MSFWLSSFVVLLLFVICATVPLGGAPWIAHRPYQVVYAAGEAQLTPNCGTTDTKTSSCHLPVEQAAPQEEVSDEATEEETFEVSEESTAGPRSQSVRSGSVPSFAVRRLLKGVDNVLLSKDEEGEAAVRRLQQLVDDDALDPLQDLTYQELETALDSLMQEDLGEFSDIFTQDALDEIAADFAAAAASQPGSTLPQAVADGSQGTPPQVGNTNMPGHPAMPVFFYNPEDAMLSQVVDVTQPSTGGGSTGFPSATPLASPFPGVTVPGGQVLLRGNNGIAANNGYVVNQQALPTIPGFSPPHPFAVSQAPVSTYSGVPNVMNMNGALGTEVSSPAVLGGDLLEGFGANDVAGAGVSELVGGVPAPGLAGLGSLGQLLNQPSSPIMRSRVGPTVQASLRNGAANALGFGSAVANAGAAGLVELGNALKQGSDSARSAVRQAPAIASRLPVFNLQ